MTSFNRLDSARLGRLREMLGTEGVRTDPGALESYGHDETENLSFQPEAVVRPANTQQVSQLLTFAAAELLPVTPRGAGTGLSGGALPVHGGLVLSLERLDRIRNIDAANLTAEAEAGVITGELQRQVERQGLFYPPDPASRDSCQIGGNIAEDAAGPRCCKYGSTRSWVLGLEAVLADGSIIHTGGKTRKNAAGYNLTQLLVGSEGTLAVVTAAVLRLLPLPRATLTLAVPFGELETAARTVAELFRRGFAPAACEILERAALEAVAALLPIPDQLAGQAALLLVELDGDDGESVLEEAVDLGELTSEMGSGEIVVAQDRADQRRLWEIRSKVGEAVKQRSVYKEADTVVPRAALSELVRTARRVAERHGLEAIAYGHAADGNLHVNLLRGELEAAEWEKRRDEAETELFAEVVRLGGTISGEHGIGWVQRRHLPLAVAKAELQLMRRLKKACDPDGILNPGKIFPDE